MRSSYLWTCSCVRALSPEGMFFQIFYEIPDGSSRAPVRKIPSGRVVLLRGEGRGGRRRFASFPFPVWGVYKGVLSRGWVGTWQHHGRQTDGKQPKPVIPFDEVFSSPGLPAGRPATRAGVFARPCPCIPPPRLGVWHKGP